MLHKVVRFLTCTDLWIRTNLEPTPYLWVNVFARWGQCLLNWFIFKIFWECIWPLPLPSHLNAVTGTCPWENPLVLIVCIHLQNSYSVTSILLKPVPVWPADGSLCKFWSHPVWTSCPQKSQQERAADSAVGIHPKICHLICMKCTRLS